MLVSPTRSMKRSPTASTAFSITHITRCWSYSSWVSSANPRTAAAANPVSTGPTLGRQRADADSAAASTLALGIAEKSFGAHQQEHDHQRKHGDGRVGQVEEISGDALDRRDQEASQNR